ncbi:MAG TPA: type I-B CRISPR-associated protein Cas7/Csh2 [Candidatus Atribacteria bacterium]|nr:type I-B CRISPR-associated protein Cas7/Csh2 [Candidatus Atribacteria bacterium]
MAEIYRENSDILFIYDAKMCNPNGDPDDENKPRMDYATKTNLVSDVRLKRYIRDYLRKLEDSHGSPLYEIFVSKVEDQTVDATKRLQALFENYEENGKKTKIDINKLEDKHIDWLLNSLIDVRFFGATMPIKPAEGKLKGTPLNFTGPIQFNWGYSLNKVEIMESSTITSHFAGRGEEGKGEYGTFGKDWRVYYSLIAFHGIISGKRAIKTKLNEKDIIVFDNAMIHAIPLEATTRSKIGQTPRLYIRIEYADDTFFLGDLRRYLKLRKDDGKIRDISEVDIDMTKLANLLDSASNKIEKIYLWEHVDFTFLSQNLPNNLKNKIQNLPHQIETEEKK